jgi:hypothetical protein
MIVADSVRFRFFNDVTVGLVLGFFSMASLEPGLVHGWKRHKKA